MDLMKAEGVRFTKMGNPFHLADEVCALLKEAGCRKYQLSLDGTRKTHDWLRSQGVRDEQVVVVELDDDRFEDQRDRRALREYVERKAPDEATQYYVILDEIQMVEAFEGAVISLNNHPNNDVYITGSNSKFLSRDIATRFKDRGTEIRVHPLSYREFYGAYAGDKRFALREYLTYGGMPHLFDEPDDAAKMRYLQGLIEQTYLSDVVERNAVRMPEVMATLNALRAGFRHIDTANGYYNEADVARGIRRSGISREQIFVSTKLWPSGYTRAAEQSGHQGYPDTRD